MYYENGEFRHYMYYRMAKTHRMPEVAGYFSQKSLELYGSFAENDL